MVGLGEAAPAGLKRPGGLVALLFGALCKLVQEPLVDLLVDTGHRAHERGPYFAQVVLDLRGVAGEGHGAAVGERVVVRDGALERVREGQEREEDVLLVEVVALVDLLDVGDDVAVRDHHALGAARSARGVDEAREVVGAGLGRELVVGDALAGGKPVLEARKDDVPAAQVRDGAGLDLLVREDDELHVGQALLACGLGDGVPACARRGDEEARVGVPEDVGGGARGVDGVKGRGHEAAAQGRLVERDGVDAVGEQHRDALALDKAHAREGAAPAHHLFVERPPGDGVPAALRIVVLAERLAFGPGGDRVAEHVRNGAEVVDKGSGVRHVSLSSGRCLVAAALGRRGSADQFSSKMACGCG